MYVCMSVCYVRLSGCLSVRMNAEISETADERWDLENYES